MKLLYKILSIFELFIFFHIIFFHGSAMAVTPVVIIGSEADSELKSSLASSANDLHKINQQFQLASDLYKRKENDAASKTVLAAYASAEKNFAHEYRLSDYAYYVAALHQNIGEYDIAEKYHRKNLEIKKVYLKLPAGQLIIAHNNLASILNLKSKYKEALIELSNVDIQSNLALERELSFIYSNIAQAHFGLKDIQKSESYMQKLKPLVNKYYGQYSVRYADMHFLQANIELARGKRKTAIKYAEQSRLLLKRLNSTNNPLYLKINEFLKSNQP